MHKLAYLTSQYPAASHTFILREIEALRFVGWDIKTFSVRPPDMDELSTDRASGENKRTYYLLAQPWIAFARAHLWGFAKHPVKYLSTLSLALSHRPPGVRGLSLACAHFAESLLLARELRRRGIEHLHNHFANSAATVGFLATRYLGIKWSFTLHGISETDYPAGLSLGRKVEAATFVASVSWFGRAQALRLVDCEHWQKVVVVHSGLPFKRLPAPRVRTGQTILSVGRLSPEKAQAGLLQAFAQLLVNRPHLKLRLVGDGPDRDKLERLSVELNIRSNVNFCGRLSEDDTLDEIAAADVFALPSLMEGLPIVLMEAMALGVPVVASRVAGIPELVEDGRNGLLFDPSDWSALADRLERLLSDTFFSRACASLAEAKVREHFDIDHSTAKLAELFDNSAELPAVSLKKRQCIAKEQS